MLLAIVSVGCSALPLTGEDDADDFRVPLVCGPEHKQLPCTRGVEEGVPYRFNLFTHCGIEWAYFGGRYWVPKPKVDPPSDWANIEVVHSWNRLAQLQGLAVRPDCLRRGVGTQLVEAAERLVRDRGCRGIYVDTPVDNDRAQDFYVAQGFTEDYRMTRYYSDALDGVTYVKFFA